MTDNDDLESRPNITPVVDEEPEEETIDDPIVRPDGQVFVQSDYCVCLNGEANSLGNCAAICQRNNTTVPTLFANVTLGPDIELNPEL